MGNPAPHSCGTALDAGLKALLSHKMSHEPDTASQLKIHVNQIVNPSQQNYWVHFDQIHFSCNLIILVDSFNLFSVRQGKMLLL